MNSALENVIIRKATKEDYKGVIGIIPDLYNGRDYMPACYYDMVKDPKRFLTLAELRGEIIGLEMYYVVDDDQVIVGQAGRIKEEYRNKGLSKQIFQHAIPYIYEKYPAVKWLSFTSQNEQEMYKFLHSPSMEKYFYRHLVKVLSQENNIIRDAASSTGFEHLCNGLPLGQTKPLTPSEALKTLDSLIGNRNILPDHAWIVSYEPFKPLHSNHITITHNNTRGMPTVIVTKDDCDDVTALSFGTITPIRKGVIFRIDFYCHKEMKEKKKGKILLTTHIAKHMILFNQVTCDNMQVVDVLLPKEMNTEDVLECLSHAGVRNYKVVERKRRAYCMETNMSMYISKI